jgi:5-carboxymethyl-2-hydroxymuconate isomerase
MPHLVLETTADLPENAHVPDILEALVLELGRFETVQSQSIKAYHTLRSVWCMGEGAPPGFAHLSVEVLTGRDLQWRKNVADAMLSVLKEHFADSLAAGEVYVTVELREMDGGTYVKAR